MTTRRLMTTTAALVALTGGTTAALASDDARDRPGDDPVTTTTTATSAAARAPRIREVEVDDDAPAGKLRLETELQSRGAAVTSVRFTYRGRTVAGRRNPRDRSEWSRVVTAAPQDLVDDARITVRVRACAGARCSTRTVSDDA